MINHTLKSFAFYGVAITSVLILFKAVTTYGENHLQAPPLINNRYHLTLAKNLPNCKKNNTLQLNFQQSGAYLNAALLPTKHPLNFDHQLTLTGNLNNQKISLSGKVNNLILCQTSPTQKNSLHTITMQIFLAKKQSITGKLNIDQYPTVEFTAQPVNNPTQALKTKH